MKLKKNSAPMKPKPIKLGGVKKKPKVQAEKPTNKKVKLLKEEATGKGKLPKPPSKKNLKETNKNAEIKSTKTAKKQAKAPTKTPTKAKDAAGKNKKKKETVKKPLNKQIESLKKIDPEFYEFLKKNDKSLLENNLLDSSDEEDENDTDDDEDLAPEKQQPTISKKQKKKQTKAAANLKEDKAAKAPKNLKKDKQKLKMQLKAKQDDSDEDEDEASELEVTDAESVEESAEEEADSMDDEEEEDADSMDEEQEEEDADAMEEAEDEADSIADEEAEEEESDSDVEEIDFDAIASESEDDNEQAVDKIHKPSGKLEVASDESDFESGADDDDEGNSESGPKKLTLQMLNEWQQELQKPHPTLIVIRKAIKAFNSALASISAAAEPGEYAGAYKVVGSALFNGVIQLCVLHLQGALQRVLGLKDKSNIPLHKTKKWPQVRSCLRHYFTDLMHLLEQVSSANILCVLLKHLHQLGAMVASFSSIGKVLLKRLIVLWSTGEETVRVLAFLCILKITRNQQESMLNHVLKAMYLSYVRNSKFVSPTTLPSINFMRRSLVEIFALDLNVAYQHAFLYIRQLAIHLRNAVILKKKDSIQSVYNWQYINSIRLWVDLLGTSTEKPQLQPLIYPLVTITTGALKLVPTAQYFPLRFHCIQALITLSKQTRTYIPVLPFILEVLRSNTFNRKHTTVSMKPMQFTCILRLNKGQMCENGFRDEVIENVCGLTLEHLASESASLAYSDLIVPAVLALKEYLKSCKNANYTRKLKQLLEKMQENARFIDGERRKVNFGLTDTAQVRAWETQVRNKGTPLDIYYNSWLKTHETKKRRQAANTDDINDYNLPTIKRAKPKSKSEKDSDGELFPSDDDDEEDGPPVLEQKQPAEKSATEAKQKQNKKQSKKSKKQKASQSAETEVYVPVEEVEDEVDIVKDLDLDDW